MELYSGGRGHDNMHHAPTSDSSSLCNACFVVQGGGSRRGDFGFFATPAPAVPNNLESTLRLVSVPQTRQTSPTDGLHASTSHHYGGWAPRMAEELSHYNH